MSYYDDENRGQDRRNPRRRRELTQEEIDYIAAVAQAIDGDFPFEIDYADAVARAIEENDAYETNYAPVTRQRPQPRDAREMQPRGHGRRRRRRGRSVMRKILFTLLTLTLGLFVFVFFFLSPPTDNDVFTVLIAGQDNVGAHGLTDTLMLVSVDTQNNTIDVVSIPRDTRVDVSWSGAKVNSVFAMTGGSINRLMEEVEKLVGFMPDFYVVLDLQAFEEIVDVLGGVYLNVPFRMQYSDPHDDPPLHIDLLPGYQRLTGEEAMHFVRYRPAVGDLGRVRNQQIFLGALATETLRVRNVSRIPAFMGVLNEYVDTNLPTSAMFYLARQMMGAGDDSLRFHTMPTENFGPDLAPVLTPWLEIINNYLNPYLRPVRLENLRLYTRIDGTIQLVGGGQSLSR